MRAKEFFMRYRTAEGKVKTFKREIERLEHASLGSQQMDGQPHGTGKSDTVANTAAKAADLRIMLEAWVAEQERIKREIIEVLGAIDDNDEFQVLQLRYLAERPADRWECIKDVMALSVRQAQRIHGRALRSAQAIIDKDGCYTETERWT